MHHDEKKMPIPTQKNPLHYMKPPTVATEKFQITPPIEKMNFEITKSFRFEAGHSLPHLPEGHQCRRFHGHSYELIVGVRGPIQSKNHWVMDYADISGIVSPLVKQLDHQDLNEILGALPTTAENLAWWFWSRLSELQILSRIEIRETPTSNVILTR